MASSHCVYVIELRKDVLQNKKFRNENPEYDGVLPCLYVGMTGLSPEQRWKNHQAGIKSSKYPHQYGVRLRPDLYEHLNPMTYEQACSVEVQLASNLKKKGCAVWQA